jgi:hypothetical protein
MGTEKSQIISLLEQGKISVDDAERLLKAAGPQWQAPRIDRQKVQDQLGRVADKVADKAGDVASTVKDRLTDAWETASPKMKAGYKTALEKTVEVVDKLAGVLREHLENVDVESDCACDCCCEIPDEEANENASSDDSPREN